VTVAAEPDPYCALPKLYGAPAYARAPKPVPDSERPFDPDDLPIVAERTDDERAFTTIPPASGPHPASVSEPEPPATPRGPAAEASGSATSAAVAGAVAVAARRLSLRALADRLGSRPK
jgi:hypothetical protein